MKTIVVLTDFSINAEYVAHYALALAQQVGANLLVCNVYLPDKTDSLPPRGQPVFSQAEEDSIHDLGAVVAGLKSSLDQSTDADSFRPDIAQCSEPGAVADVLEILSGRHDLLMAVISTHSADYLRGLFAKNHARAIIEKAGVPVMVVPYQVRFRPFQTIAFASAMMAEDRAVLPAVIGLAKYSGAHVLLVHVISGNPADEPEADAFRQHVDQLAALTGHPQIGYRNIRDKNPAAGLRWVSRQRTIDLVVLVHRRRTGLQQMLNGSVTRKLLQSANRPLLIFPGGAVKTTS